MEGESVPVVIALAVFFLIVIAITLPAGYGLPAPLFALVALGASLPGLVVAWLIYRSLVRRGDIAPIGAGPNEGLDRDTSHEPGPRPTHREPNREQAATRGRFFPKAD
jgi:hypothetical protein